MATIAELFQAAVRYHQAGNLALAEPLYRQVLQADPKHAEAHHLLGHLALQGGHHEAALGFFRQAVTLNPNNAEATINLGTVYFLQKQLVEAAACFRQALRLDPNLAVAHYNLGNVHAGQGQMDEAAECFRHTLRLNPNHADAHNNLGNILAHQGQWSEAGQIFQQAIAINSNHGEAHNNLGNVYKVAGQFDLALASFQRALAINPNHADAYANLGLTQAHHGQFAEAAACYEQALRINPRHSLALGNRSLLRLLQGDFAGSWPDFEQRWARPGILPRSCKQPRWAGAPLEGKTILVYAEQGLGDTIQFVRYLPLVQRRGGKVLFECPPALFGLLTGFPGIDQITRAGEPLPSFQTHIPLLSLPGLFGTTLATIPGANPYLGVDPDKVEHWRQQITRNGAASTFAVGTRLNIGIAWQGNPNHDNDRARSVPLEQFSPLARLENARLVSLQVGPGTDQLKTSAIPIIDLGSRFDPQSLNDLAAVLMNLDLVVTVDTAVAHLAGALGIPVWVALPMVPDWRWLLERSDSPWYPTMRLFRQRKSGDWGEVLARIAAEIPVFINRQKDKAPLPPVIRGERGWGEGVGPQPELTPHPRPLSPEYRGEGSFYNVTFESPGSKNRLASAPSM